MWGLYGFYNIRFAQQDRLDSFIHSSIDPIAENPIYLIQHEGFHFFPENFGSARLSYVRKPPSIVWGWLPERFLFGTVDGINYLGTTLAVGQRIMFDSNQAVLVTQGNALYYLMDETKTSTIFKENTPEAL